MNQPLGVYFQQHIRTSNLTWNDGELQASTSSLSDEHLLVGRSVFSFYGDKEAIQLRPIIAHIAKHDYYHHHHALLLEYISGRWNECELRSKSSGDRWAA